MIKTKSSIVLIFLVFLVSILMFCQKAPQPFNDKELNSLYTLSGLQKLDSTQLPENLLRKEAISLGKLLFFDTGFSSNGKISCATCHDPKMSWTDRKITSEGLGKGHRNTMSLWNVVHNRWFFWDGRTDSPWAQALGPMENPDEMDGDRMAIVRRVLENNEMRTLYESVFTPMHDFNSLPAHASPIGDSLTKTAWEALSEYEHDLVNETFTNIGKAIYAFEATIISNDSPFDRFVQSLRENRYSDDTWLNQEAIEGLKIFIGRGNCLNCHNGPNFTDNEFHRIRLKQDQHNLDPGRYAGIDILLSHEFNALSPYALSDKPALVGYLERDGSSWGQFKTPSLRNVSETAPYMHDGRFSNLERVIQHYSFFENAESPDHHGETILIPLLLTEYEQQCMTEFLRSLKDDDLEGIL